MTRTTIVLLAALAAAGCATAARRPLPTVAVDLPRYMGTWFVVASIPTLFERDAYAATESYALAPDGTIAATFEYHKGSFDGPLKTMHPRGFVQAGGQGVWGMRIVWPIKSEYRIAYLDRDYTQVIVARSARDHVWIMARTPRLSANDYAQLVERVRAMDYDVTRLQKVPQRGT